MLVRLILQPEKYNYDLFEHANVSLALMEHTPMMSYVTAGVVRYTGQGLPGHVT